MKYKILVIALAVFLVVFALYMSKDDDKLLDRTHQHLEAVQKSPCTADDHEFCTHLPIIMLDMDGIEPTVEYVQYDNGVVDAISADVLGDILIIDQDQDNNHPTDPTTDIIKTKIRIRGNSSKAHNKKNYRLSFIYADGGENKEHGLLGMEPHDEWALHGPYLDRSLIRNYMCMNIAGQILPYTPDVRFCELFINGEYRGVYVAMETISRGEGRVNITPYDPGDDVSSYMISVDWYADSPSSIEPFTAYTRMTDFFTDTEIMYPGKLALTPVVEEYITQQLSDYEKALYSFDYDDKNYGYTTFYHEESFIDYLIVNEFFQNYDAGNISTFFYKDIGGQFSIGPVWDFNNSMDNFSKVMPDFSVIYAPRFNMMMKDEEFVRRVIDRYHNLRENVLSEEYLLNYIDETVTYLGPAIDRNYKIWDDAFDDERMQPEIQLDDEWRNPESYEESIDMLKDYIRRRGSWLDEHIETLYQYSHESMVKKYNH